MRVIKIPRLDPDKLHEVKIMRSGFFATKSAQRFSLAKQTIEGLTVPQNTEIWVPNSKLGISDLLLGKAKIQGDILNALLRKLYLDILRDGKRK